MSLAKAHLDDNAREILHHIRVYMSHKEAIVSCQHQNGKLNFSNLSSSESVSEKFRFPWVILIPKLLQLFLDIEFRSQIYSGV